MNGNSNGVLDATRVAIQSVQVAECAYFNVLSTMTVSEVLWQLENIPVYGPDESVRSFVWPSERKGGTYSLTLSSASRLALRASPAVLRSALTSRTVLFKWAKLLHAKVSEAAESSSALFSYVYR